MKEEGETKPHEDREYSEVLRDHYEELRREQESPKGGPQGLAEVKLRLFLALLKKPDPGCLSNYAHPPGQP